MGTNVKPRVDRVREALKTFTPDKWDYSPVALVGNGLEPPAKLQGVIDGVVVAKK